VLEHLSCPAKEHGLLRFSDFETSIRTLFILFDDGFGHNGLSLQRAGFFDLLYRLTGVVLAVKGEGQDVEYGLFLYRLSYLCGDKQSQIATAVWRSICKAR
jgi:hypothetical protein